ncbi:c-5 sterol desaturase [Conoideocrella luteorostrata]|uniref:C-5 sterol desaturase n=1 Tax=Conoideocrella luteorostrata TaxID=1105319 RepID=A0AAJ0CNJ8_9HYPO|nr:c-5 sterol desaturase [Conoideocrella luteorostrata]
MDVILDLYETFIGDHVFARLHPAQSTVHNSSLSNSTSLPYGVPCIYKPSTKYFTVRPSPAVCMSAWPRDKVYRQAVNLFLIFCHNRSLTNLSSRRRFFGAVVYFFFSTLSYAFIFDKQMKKHPKYLKNQVWMEIEQTLWALPGLSLLTLPFVLAEARGYSKMYDTSAEGPGKWYDILQFPFFILFTDFCIYWIHRWLHNPMVYKTLHKKHHKWIVPTPFAAYAFHPIDGWVQSLPYHIFTFLFPMQKFAFLALFVFVNFWSILIHDGEYLANNPIINGAACHTIHHLYFNYNYGQYTTLWDRLGGSHRKPQKELFEKEKKKDEGEWERQSKEMESMVVKVEGKDDRVYSPSDSKKNN